jgi:hypothetical protein
MGIPESQKYAPCSATLIPTLLDSTIFSDSSLHATCSLGLFLVSHLQCGSCVSDAREPLFSLKLLTIELVLGIRDPILKHWS